MKTIFGRQAEIAVLERLFQSKRAEFLAVYGRRRIGKTFLISEYFKDKGVYFEVTGSKKASKKDQLKRFYNDFASRFPEYALKMPVDWSEALDLIKNVVEKLDPSIKFVFFLDELPWLASPKSGFLSALDYAWNHYLSRFPNVLLIVCGSAASWIIRKVVKDKGGLHGRLSATIRLQPFSLAESEQFLLSQGIHLKRKQLIELYMAMGGVAKYLMSVQPGKSSTQIINDLCFSQNGFLFSEFTELYQSLFDDSERHIAIVRALAQKRKGMYLEELLRATNMSHGGRMTEILEELEESGFILRMPSFGKDVRNRKIRLIDEYTFFYLSWIEKSRPTLLKSLSSDSGLWNRLAKTPAWYEWAGHAFETICLKHMSKVKAALGIAGVATEESHWQYFPSRNDGERGAEVDILMDRADECIHLIDSKFCNEEFVITAEYAQHLERKKQVFQRVTGTKKTIFLTMITPFGVVKNEHYLGLVDQQLTMDDLF